VTSQAAPGAPPAFARAQRKDPQRRTARAGWHSFDEYAFLKDSRYASQPENPARAYQQVPVEPGRIRVSPECASC
jgi:hypothetical protein